MQTKRITIRDVAKIAGVSVPTVSQVINGTGRISESTTERVMNVVRELNYIPDSRARSMRTSCTKTVGLVVPDLRSNYWSNLVYSVQSTMLAFGYSTLIGAVYDDIERQDSFLRFMISQRIDGFIVVTNAKAGGVLPSICPKPGQTSEEMSNSVVIDGIEYLRNFDNVPVVFVDRIPEKQFGVSTVTCDPATGIAEALTIIKQSGHEKIAYVSGIVGVSPVLLKREKTFRDIASRSFKSENCLIARLESFDNSIESVISSLMAKGVTCIVFGCSEDALNAAEYMRENNIVIGKDISVVSFDDISEFRFMTPRLSCISQHITDIGETASRILVDAMKAKQEKITQEVKNVQTKSEFIQRESIAKLN